LLTSVHLQLSREPLH